MPTGAMSMGVVWCLLETHGRTAQEAARRLQANLLLAEALLCAGQAPAAERPLAVASARPVASLRSRILQAQAKVALFAEDFKKAMSMASEAVRMEAGEAGDVKALLALKCGFSLQTTKRRCGPLARQNRRFEMRAESRLPGRCWPRLADWQRELRKGFGDSQRPWKRHGGPRNWTRRRVPPGSPGPWLFSKQVDWRMRRWSSGSSYATSPRTAKL